VSDFTRSLGLTLPVLQAPMAGVQGAALAAAVDAAGGLGAIPGATLAPSALARELTTLAARGVSRVNVNFFCHVQEDAPPARIDAWCDALAPYYAELGLARPTVDELAAAPTRAPFDEALADAVAPFRPAIVSFHFGLPSEALLSRVRSWGSRVVSTATTVAEARWLEARGVDAIVVQGLEAGGHRGHFLDDDLATHASTGTLLPQVVAAVRVPVIAAGGIADAAGVATALRLGAAAVQVGTSYLCCDEATTSAVHRAALASGERVDTDLTTLFSGRAARGIVNRLMRDLGPRSPLVPPFPHASAALAPLRAAAEARGLGDFSPLWAGTDTRGCRAESATVLTRRLAGVA
jgi:nitronate monooxygenase